MSTSNQTKEHLSDCNALFSYHQRASWKPATVKSRERKGERERGRWEDGAEQIVKERKEKERVRLLHTVQHAGQNTTSLYANAPTSEWYYCYCGDYQLYSILKYDFELQGNGIWAQQTINMSIKCIQTHAACTIIDCIWHALSFLCVRLPRVGGDGRLWHSRPDRAVHGPGATPEMSASKGRGGGGGGRCSRLVREPRYWKEKRNSFFNKNFQDYSCIAVSPSEEVRRRTRVEFRTVHGSDHRTQLPSSCSRQKKKLDLKRKSEITVSTWSVFSFI